MRRYIEPPWEMPEDARSDLLQVGDQWSEFIVRDGIWTQRKRQEFGDDPSDRLKLELVVPYHLLQRRRAIVVKVRCGSGYAVERRDVLLFRRVAGSESGCPPG